MTRLRAGQSMAALFDPLYGGEVGSDGSWDVPPSLSSRQDSSITAASGPSSIDMASSPASAAPGPAPSGSRIGRPPQWTTSRSRKLARLYLYTTLSIEKIIKVLEDDGFNPRKNSAQKTIHKMLDNDPRYLRPESRSEMAKRIKSLAMSPARRKKGNGAPGARVSRDETPAEKDNLLSSSGVTSPSGQSVKTEDIPSFDFATSPGVPGLGNHAPLFTAHERGTIDTTESGRGGRHEMIRDIKRRVSDCSTQYAFQLSALIQEFTISFSSDDGGSTGRRQSAASSEGPGEDCAESQLPPGTYESFPDPGFSLPGDFLTSHTRNCADFPGQQHGEGDCWCSIAQKTSAQDDSWLMPTGELSERATRVLHHPSPAALGLRDSFGNTPLHLFGALGGYEEALLGMVAKADNENLREVNTAGQTFLHVLSIDWFTDLASPSAPLKRLLARIEDSCPELVYESDVYGRTFLHRAQSVVRDAAALASLVSRFNPALASRRDAFGFNPVTDSDPTSRNPYIQPRRIGSLSPQVEELARANSNSRPQSSDEGSFLAYHARLVEIIQSSYTDPRVEDADGRNGLHCLAEAILNQQAMDRHVQGVQRAASSSASRHLKRKLDSSKETVTATSASASPSPGPSTSGPAPTADATLPTRLRHLQSLLHPSVAVSVSHYDRRGFTPLMAFIERIPDDQDDKSRMLQTILETLIRAGCPPTGHGHGLGSGSGPGSGPGSGQGSRPGPRHAGVQTSNINTRTMRMRLEARNRRGETALLVAARLGRKVALATLLECGANVRARDADGRGVLEVIDREVVGARAGGDLCLYARLEACRVLLTGRRDWGVGYVGADAVVREWRVKQGPSVM